MNRPLVWLILVAVCISAGLIILTIIMEKQNYQPNQPLSCQSKTLPLSGVSSPITPDATSNNDTACSGSVSGTMYFTDMPLTLDEANSSANDMAISLKQFANQNQSPIIIAEPTDDQGQPLDMNQLAEGSNSSIIDAYFNRLRGYGITDKMMGLWIPFPEPDQPDWKNMTTENFGKAANNYLMSLRRVFPMAKTGILLDSETGNSEREADVLAYAASVDKSLVDVAGLQGFPWPPSEDSGSASDDNSAASFLPATMATKIAEVLGTKEVLLNTGSYSSYRDNQGKTSFADTSGRTAALSSIVNQTKILKNGGYNVTVNIFAQDKLATTEGINWSYSSSGQSGQSKIYNNFVRQLSGLDFKISVYNSDN